MYGKGPLFALILGTLISVSYSDVYMHNPRGSNNRLNERSANRRNANRCFDSQNNNRGGYNVGDRGTRAANKVEDQYQMEYMQSDKIGKSKLLIEWTNQHGCGGDEDKGPHKLNCNMVLQYMCQPSSVKDAHELMRDGLETNTPDFRDNRRNFDKESEGARLNRRRAGSNLRRVLQEDWDSYEKCRNRERNKGLFTADQKLKGEEAIYTRQNPGGTRRGYECPEERDYYPYWHPTPWKDLLVLAENASMCDHYTQKSHNVQSYYECVHKFPGTDKPRFSSKYNNKGDCEGNNGEWLEFTNYLEKAKPTNVADCNKDSNLIWGRPYGEYSMQCLVRLKKPECKAAMWSRVNHLGNGREGRPLNWTWILPYFPSGNDQRCVLRLRYNISTDDYDPYKTFSSSNEDKNKGKVSPIRNNPEVDIGGRNIPLRLAINTAQFGRTFQDRSHIFYLKARPDALLSKTIHNLNVRGKRGNIVQVFPAVEYDFIPNNLEIKEGEAVHIQWTGSNSHNNGNPAGDGQAGDAGEGTGGTDRSNFMETKSPDQNYPCPFEQCKMFQNAKVLWTSHPKMKPETYKDHEVAISFASAGYFGCMSEKECDDSLEKKGALNNLLNNAPASYKGMVLRFSKGKYYYMCSRNNNFTNRSQKGYLLVKQ